MRHDLIISLRRCNRLENALLSKATIETIDLSIARVEDSIVLDISEGIGQGKSQLCWSFTALSGLEARYMAKNPLSTPLFSRAAMQRNNTLERGKRSFVLKTDKFMERGVFVNGLSLVKMHGVIPYEGRPLLTERHYTRELVAGLNVFRNQEEKIKEIENIVNSIFFSFPEKVSFEEREFTPRDLAKEIIGNDNWISYRFDGVSSTKGSWDNHPDSDAMVGTKSWKVDATKKEEILLKALGRGYPVEMTFSGHSVLIFGVDLDIDGKALEYYIKDSYLHGRSYTYKSRAKRTHAMLWELSTLDVRELL